MYNCKSRYIYIRQFTNAFCDWIIQQKKEEVVEEEEEEEEEEEKKI